MSKIVAIDFETANERSASAISIGYAVIEEDYIIDYNNIFIKPHDSVSKFLPQNIRIHHITPDMVKNAPSFKEIYEEKLCKIFEDACLVAHNAAFDMRVLKSLFGLYDIPLINYKYFCSVELSKKIWPNLHDHKMPTVAESINYNLQNHHNSMYDAIACAKIVTSAMKDLDTKSFEGLCFLSGIKIGKILNTEQKYWNELNKFKPNLNSLSKFTEQNYSKHPFYHKSIAKIGEFTHTGMSGEEIAQHLMNINSYYNEFILNETDLVVLSDKYYNKKTYPKYISSLIMTANEKHKKIISETEFTEMLFSADYLDNKTGMPKFKPYEYI